MEEQAARSRNGIGGRPSARGRWGRGTRNHGEERKEDGRGSHEVGLGGRGEQYVACEAGDNTAPNQMNL
eukprot:7747297-Pyramimonas_sp.AAC.1